MYFNQLTAYRLGGHIPDAATLAAKLTDESFAPVSGLDWFGEGFTAPQPFSDSLVFETDGILGIALKRQEKVLPSGAIKEKLAERIAEIESEESRKVGRIEQKQLKEQIIDDLLPRALTRSTMTHAVLDKRSGFLLVNNASANKAENLLHRLRVALGGLEAHPLATQIPPSSLMTEWLLQGACAGSFKLDSDCELKGQGDDTAVVKVSKQDLTADEVVQHLKSGKTVTQLGLVWREQLAFVLTADFTLKRIQYLDVLQEQAEQQGDDAATFAFASQILMTRAITEMLQELADHLGGFSKKV